MTSAYSKENIIDSLKKVGLESGDTVFIYSNIGFFGNLKDAQMPDDYWEIFKEAIFSVIGASGTLVAPTFSFSFCWKHDFDKLNTPGICGFLSEKVRTDPEAKRSIDANFSVAAIGKDAEFLTADAPQYSFGPGSFWHKFLKRAGKFCNFNFDSASTFIHYVERELKVPYRYDKGFPGFLIIDGRKQKGIFYHFVYDLEKQEHAPEFTKFDKKAKEAGLAKIANLGKGQIVLISAGNTFDLIKAEIKSDPTFLIKAGLKKS